MTQLVPNNPALITKQKELHELALAAIPSDILKGQELASALIDSFVELTPPFMSSEVFEIRMITMTPQGTSGG